MKTKLKHVGVTSDIKKGQNTVKIFDKHELGQAFLLSKEMFTKVLGIDEKKFMAMKDDDLEQRLLMLDFPDVPGEKKKKKKNVVEN